MTIIVCAIAKNENQYINEWCHHYIDMGFSHIYLYDNNDPSTKFVGSCIDKELLDKITIINKRGQKMHGMQVFCYKDLYRKAKFDWCLFCDIDEFLTGIDNIETFLLQDKFKDCEQIKFLWKCFGDNDTIKRDVTIPVTKFFTKEALTLRRPMVKCMVKGGIRDLAILGVHLYYRYNHTPLNTYLPSGYKCNIKESLDVHLNDPDVYNNETIFINHYITKTLDEFLNQKYLQDDPCFLQRPRLFEDYYWKYNTRTPEKEAYIQQYLQEHNLEYK